MSQRMGKGVSKIFNQQIATEAEERPYFKASKIFWSVAASFLGMGIVCFLAFEHKLPLLVTSFGSSAVLLYAACDSPMAQPKNVLGGHIISALAGVLVYHLCGAQWWSYALAVSLAIAGMELTSTMHAPGGATAFIAVYSEQKFSFIFTPVAIGAAVLVLMALLLNNLDGHRRYPQSWW